MMNCFWSVFMTFLIIQIKSSDFCGYYVFSYSRWIWVLGFVCLFRCTKVNVSVLAKEKCVTGEESNVKDL